MRLILIILGCIILFWICRALWRFYRLYRQMNGLYGQARRMYGFGGEERTTERPRARRQQQYGGYSRDNGRKIPPEYAVDVEYEEVEVIEDGRKTYSSSEKSVKVESQVSDADWEEVK